MSTIDVAVVGGGPVGLATAVALRQAGLGVTLFERRRPPVDKPCGEGLMPDALEQLRGLGVDPAKLPGRPFRGIRYRDENSDVRGRFPGEPGLGVRRLRLHEALRRRAEAAGAELRWGETVEAVEPSDDAEMRLRLEGLEQTARFVVAADGLRSPLRAAAGLAGPPSRDPRFGVRRHFRIAPWSDCVEVHWANGSEAYVTPIASDEVGVAILFRRGDAGGRQDPARGATPWQRLLAAFPELQQRLDGAVPTSDPLGTGPLRQRVRAVIDGRLLLVGDAGGYLDAITGEGLALGLQQARAAAAAIASGRLADYARARRRWARRPELLTRLTLVLSRHPALRRRVLRSFERRPELFERLLAVHVRVAGAREGGAALLALGWQLLRPA